MYSNNLYFFTYAIYAINKNIFINIFFKEKEYIKLNSLVYNRNHCIKRTSVQQINFLSKTINLCNIDI